MVKKYNKILYALCVISLMMDFFLIKKSSFEGYKIDAMFGFYPLLGVLSYLFFLIVSSVIRAILGTKDDYYERS